MYFYNSYFLIKIKQKHFFSFKTLGEKVLYLKYIHPSKKQKQNFQVEKPHESVFLFAKKWR